MEPDGQKEKATRQHHIDACSKAVSKFLKTCGQFSNNELVHDTTKHMLKYYMVEYALGMLSKQSFEYVVTNYCKNNVLTMSLLVTADQLRQTWKLY